MVNSALVAIRKLMAGGLAVMFLSGCAGYDGRNLKPGESLLSEVVESMGVPAMNRNNFV